MTVTNGQDPDGKKPATMEEILGSSPGVRELRQERIVNRARREAKNTRRENMKSVFAAFGSSDPVFFH